MANAITVQSGIVHISVTVEQFPSLASDFNCPAFGKEVKVKPSKIQDQQQN